MTTPDPILNALAQMEQRLRDEVRDSYREFKLEMIGSFDGIHHRLDRLEQECEMLRAGMARLEADVGALKEGVARLETEMVFVKEAIARLEARIDREQSDREDLREQALRFRRRLDELEGRVQELESHLPRE